MRQALIRKFCKQVNGALAQQQDRSGEIYTALKATLADDSLLSLLESLKRDFEAANHPSQFVNQRIMTPGTQLDQCYELLSMALGEDILDPKDAYAGPLLAERPPGVPLDYTMIGRFWSVSGLQQYSPNGTLMKYHFDPLTVTNSVAAVVTGNYIALEKHPGLGIGGIGQAASRPGMRGQGHGKFVVEAFEAEMSRIAAASGQQLCLMVLEAEEASRPFWAGRGYRYPIGTRYKQPPIDYDRVTGKPLFPAVPELLMVKPIGDDTDEAVDRALLIDAVHSLYNKWYMFDYIPEKARPEAEAYVFGTLFRDFLDSLPPGDGPVPLVLPPIERGTS
ncbi:MAG TPA: hypothetical protein VKT82_03235 [Ktedonobacterales bacterium]|nr:hypothetical protein [Ktedonobacterales bacterium]